MKFNEKAKEKAGELIKRAWVTQGMPFDLTGINEKVEGIIDVEALLMATFLVMEQDRMVTDLPAWLGRFSSLINHQKLKTLFKTLPDRHKSVIFEKLSRGLFVGAPKSVRMIFNLKEEKSEAASNTIQMRGSKLNTIDNVARASIMIHNRLLYGTGCRADLITLTHIEGLGLKGTQLARLLCTNNSTVSRILKDLRACRFLNHENERLVSVESYAGMFISTQTLWNLCEMINAFEFSFEELKQDVLENLDLRHDGFGREVITALN